MKKLLLPALLSLLAASSALAQDNAQVRSVAEFHAIKVGSGVSLALTAGHAQRVEVSASTPVLRDHLRTTVADGVLSITFDNADRGYQQRNTKLRVAVTADQLTALTAGSGSSVQSHGNIAAATFQLDVSSGASLQADIDAKTLSVSQGSGSSVSLAGRAPSLEIHAGSGASFSGKKLQTDRCRADASSGASVEVAVKDDLIATASSGGSISYSGSPQVTKHVSSGGSVGGR